MSEFSNPINPNIKTVIAPPIGGSTDQKDFPEQPSHQPPEQKGLLEKIRAFVETRRGKVTVGIAGVALAGGITGGVWAANSGHAPEKAPHSTSAPNHTTHTVAPSNEATPSANPETSIDQLVAAHEISAGQTPEALSQNVLSELSEWTMAGSDTVIHDWQAEVKKTLNASDAAESTFLDNYTAKQATIYATALFGENYASNPDLQRVIAGEISINKESLTNVIASNKDANPYKRSVDFSSLVTSSDTGFSVNYVEKDNAGQNNRVPGSNVNGATGTISVTYEVQNGKIVIKTFRD